MMPPKRKLPLPQTAIEADNNNNNNNNNNSSTGTPNVVAPMKRQRVSRACDQCRSAREKCDGIQPQCFSCVSLNRECTYNVAPKKRGVQTGLIRTLESALVWVFEQYPGAEASLNDLLAQESGPESLLIGKESEAGNRLHRRWRKCKAHKEIDRLLSGKEATSPKAEPSEEEESGTEADPQANANLSQAPDPSSRRKSTHGNLVQPTRRSFKLPTGYSRLLDIYFAYTHSWLPIVDKERLYGLVSGDSEKEIQDIELWCALAVASLQDPSRTSDSAAIYRTARSLLPLVGEAHARASATAANARDGSQQQQNPAADILQESNGFLLLSLISLGRDDVSDASLWIGMAVRTALSLSHVADDGSLHDFAQRKTRTVMTCFLLDTLVSRRLGHPPHLTPALLGGIHPLAEEGPEEWDSWVPQPGFGNPEMVQDVDIRSIQSISSLNQLCHFSRVLTQSFTSPHAPHAADLAKVLDPRFSFCNSILGGSTPCLPTAYLLEASFLSATLGLTPNPRVSLLYTLMEAIEHSWDHLGAGVPPLFVTYMSIASGRTGGLGSEDKSRWDDLLEKLKSTWQAPPDTFTQDQMPTDATQHASQPSPSSRQQQATEYPSYQSMVTPSDQFSHTPNNFFGAQAATATSPSTSRSMPFTPGSTNQLHGYPPPNPGGGMVSPSSVPVLQQVPPYLLLQGSNDPLVDHDAILDELAAIDCTDSMDADPQFMANLGFTSGSDFTDMREFGAL